MQLHCMALQLRLPNSLCVCFIASCLSTEVPLTCMHISCMQRMLSLLPSVQIRRLSKVHMELYIIIISGFSDFQGLNV